MKDQYAEFARDYDWLYPDRQQAGERQVRGAVRWLDGVDGARILDCACGTGIFALALARHGYDVVATDASSEMIAQAGRHAEREALSLPLSVHTWRELPRHFGPEFDFVFCGGNSIGHCRDEAEMTASLAAMRRVLKTGGRLVLETRDWEALLTERVRFTSFGPRERDGERCIPLYVWNFAEDLAAPVVIEVVLPIESSGRVTVRSFPIVYHPFTLAQLVDRASAAGFRDVETEALAGGNIQLRARTP